MISIGYFRDRTHGRKIPTGRPLANLTSSVLHMCAADAIRQIYMFGRADLSRWIPSFMAAAAPMISVWVREGQRQRARELLAAIENRRRKSKSLVRKAITGPWAPYHGTGFNDLSFGFDVFNPNVTEYIRNATYSFVKSTLETAAVDASKAYATLRATLSEGLRGGEGTQAINRRLYQIFADPYRAARVGQTEASRAQNGGAYMLAQQSGVTTIRWLASSDACEKICLPLNGQERPIGQPFLILPKAKPPYNIVMHPPAHAHCFCVTQDIIDDVAAVNESTVAKLSLAAYDPSATPQRFKTASLARHVCHRFQG